MRVTRDANTVSNRRDHSERVDDENNQGEIEQEMMSKRENWNQLARPDWWNLPGPHVGRGPRHDDDSNSGLNELGSDAAISEQVSRRLSENGQLDARDIRVSVKNHCVVLSGTAASDEARGLASDLAASVPGVDRVVLDDLCVARKGQSRPASDARSTPHLRLGKLRLGQVAVGQDRKEAGVVKGLYDRHLVLGRDGADDLRISYSDGLLVNDDDVTLVSPAHEVDRPHRHHLAGTE